VLREDRVIECAALVFSTKHLQEGHQELYLSDEELTTQLIATHDKDCTPERAC